MLWKAWVREGAKKYSKWAKHLDSVGRGGGLNGKTNFPSFFTNKLPHQLIEK